MSDATSRSSPDPWAIAAEQFTPGKVWVPYPWQIPPDDIATQGLWLIMGGRGIGKTDGCAHDLNDHVNGPPCDKRLPGGHRPAIIGPTAGDAVEACVNGATGLRAIDPGIRSVVRPGGIYVLWPNGTEGKLFGAYSQEDVERLRAGGNRCIVWVEEVAAWRYLEQAYQHARYGLRIGPNPHAIGSSTPKPRPPFKELLEDDHTVVTHGTTAQAHHLNAAVRERLYADYGGTPLGRQELEGVLLTSIEGALWTTELLERHRVWDHTPAFWLRSIVALDPAAGTESGDEQGLAVVSQSAETYELYVRESEGYRIDVWEWLKTAIDMALTYEATIVWEDTGSEGAWIRKALDQMMAEKGVMVPHKAVKARDGKRLRAEPVAGLYHQGKVHHIGYFDTLESQMCNWTGLPKDRQPSPDRLDALVYACTQFIGYDLVKHTETSDSQDDTIAYNDRSDGVIAYR